jgi:hypothetical protein
MTLIGTEKDPNAPILDFKNKCDKSTRKRSKFVFGQKGVGPFRKWRYKA